MRSTRYPSLMLGLALIVGAAACAPAAPSPTPAPAKPAEAKPTVAPAATSAPAAAAKPTEAAKPATAGAGPIRIGAFGPVSGDAAAYGKSVRESLEMAVDEANKAGGILGQQVEFLLEDDAGKPEQAVSICNKLTSQDKVPVVVGGISSPTSLACSEVTERAQVPQVITGGTAARITQRGNKFIFRIPVPDTRLGQDVARFAQKKGWKKIALLHVNDDFGNGGAKAVSDEAQKLGLEVVTDESYTRGDKEFTAQLAQIKRASPDVLVEWSRYAEGALIAQQKVDLGMTMPHIGSDGFSAPQYIQLGQEAVEGVYYTAHWSIASTHPYSREWVQRFQARFNHEPDAFNAQTYAAALVVFDALKRAGAPDPVKLRDAIAATKDVDTPVRKLSFNEQGDPAYDTFLVQIKDGKEVPAE